MAVELYDEHEQSERVRRWIKEYGFSIVLGLVLAFGGIFGYRTWQDQQVTQRYLAAEYFDVIQRELDGGDLDFAEEQYQAMRDSVSRSAYVGLAGMLMAGAYIEDGRLEPAARIYRDILANRKLEAVQPVATVRLARILEAQGDVQAALALVEGEAPPGFQGAWADVRGDLLLSRGELEQARMAYQEALDNLAGDGRGRHLIQMKIDATGPGLAEDAS
jgi:predicted negative regulator of RcsB-dependent stress response